MDPPPPYIAFFATDPNADPSPSYDTSLRPPVYPSFGNDGGSASSSSRLFPDFPDEKKSGGKVPTTEVEACDEDFVGPLFPPVPAAPEIVDYSHIVDPVVRKVVGKEAERVWKRYEKAVKDHAKAVKDYEKALGKEEKRKGKEVEGREKNWRREIGKAEKERLKELKMAREKEAKIMRDWMKDMSNINGDTRKTKEKKDLSGKKQRTKRGKEREGGDGTKEIIDWEKEKQKYRRVQEIEEKRKLKLLRKGGRGRVNEEQKSQSPTSQEKHDREINDNQTPDNDPIDWEKEKQKYLQSGGINESRLAFSNHHAHLRHSELLKISPRPTTPIPSSSAS